MSLPLPLSKNVETSIVPPPSIGVSLFKLHRGTLRGAVVGIALLLAACSDKRSSPSPSPTAAAASSPAPVASSLVSDASNEGPAAATAAIKKSDARPLPSKARLLEPFRGAKGTGLVAITSVAERSVTTYGSGGSSKVDADTPVLVASFTKLWTAVAALRLIERKELALDDAIRDVLPDLASRPWADSTLRELMGHVSRVPEFDEKTGFYRLPGVDFSEAPSSVIAKYVPKDWTEKRGVYKYRNAEFAIVGAMLAARARTPTAAVLAREVFGPAQMKHAGILNGGQAAPTDLDLTPMGPIKPQNFFTAGAGYASMSDLLSFFEALSTTALLNAESKATLFVGAKEHNYASYGCWAFTFNGKTLVERPGSFGNIRLFTAFFPEESRAVIAWNGDGTEIPRPRTSEQGIGARLSRIALE